MSNTVAKPDTGKVIVTGVMDKIAQDGSAMLDGVQDAFAELLQPPRITFFILDTSFHKTPQLVEFYAIVEKVRSGELDPVVFKVLRLEQAVEAYELLISGAAVKGKMLFVVDAELAAERGI